MVIWNAFLDNGNKFHGLCDDGSWKDLPSMLGSNKIVSLSIENTQGSGKIDENKDGYFIGNKIIGSLGNDQQLSLVGIGYWQKHDDVARIKWYDTNTMQLFTTEARHGENCGLSLIKNP